jgi:hypothetical protein
VTSSVIERRLAAIMMCDLRIDPRADLADAETAAQQIVIRHR